MTVGTLEAVVGAVGGRLDARIRWQGSDFDRLMDGAHATLAASIKARLERWSWIVRPEVTFSQYGERGRIDLLACHPATGTILVVEVKTDLVDVQALLGSMDMRARLAPTIARRLGWTVRSVVPAIVFLEDRTTRRRLASYAGLFDRFALLGQPAITWVRRPASPAPSGLLWFRSLPNVRVMRIGGQRVRIRKANDADRA